nr:thiamine pyrophosphate-binding protein [Acetobacter persici]
MQISSLDAAGQKGMRRGAAVLLEILRSEGVDYIFGNPGTTELPLMDALLEVPNVSYILGLQEASVVAMADGYAQAARRPGFLNLHTAGGWGMAWGICSMPVFPRRRWLLRQASRIPGTPFLTRSCLEIWCRLPALP